MKKAFTYFIAMCIVLTMLAGCVAKKTAEANVEPNVSSSTATMKR